MEKISRRDYAELVMIKEDNYNEREFSEYIFRSLNRLEKMFDIEDD